MNAHLYLRVSTKRQAAHGVSMPDGDDEGVQERTTRALAHLRGWSVLDIEKDPLSGRKAHNRRGLQKQLDRVCADKGVLIVYSLSRLSRSACDMHNICRRLEKAGASLASATESVDTTSAMGKAFFGLLAVFAQLESDQTGERVRAADKFTREKYGHRVMGAKKYGWRLDPETHLLVPNPKQQRTIARVLELHAQSDARNLSYADMADLLNAEGVKSPRGNDWTARGVRVFVGRHRATVAAIDPVAHAQP